MIFWIQIYLIQIVPDQISLVLFSCFTCVHNAKHLTENTLIPIFLLKLPQFFNLSQYSVQFTLFFTSHHIYSVWYLYIIFYSLCETSCLSPFPSLPWNPSVVPMIPTLWNFPRSCEDMWGVSPHTPYPFSLNIRYIVVLNPADGKPYSLGVKYVCETEGSQNLLAYLKRNVNRKHKKHVHSWLCQSVADGCYQDCELHKQCPNIHVTAEGFHGRRNWLQPRPSWACGVESQNQVNPCKIPLIYVSMFWWYRNSPKGQGDSDLIWGFLTRKCEFEWNKEVR